MVDLAEVTVLASARVMILSNGGTSSSYIGVKVSQQEESLSHLKRTALSLACPKSVSVAPPSVSKASAPLPGMHRTMAEMSLGRSLSIVQ